MHLVNKKDATVTIVKDAQPDAAQDFDYTTTGAGRSVSRLTMTPIATLPNEKRSRSSGGDSVRRRSPSRLSAGWSNTSLVCSEGTVAGFDGDAEVDPGDRSRVPT